MGPIYLGFTDLSFLIHVLLEEHHPAIILKKEKKIALIVGKKVDAGELCVLSAGSGWHLLLQFSVLVTCNAQEGH